MFAQSEQKDSLRTNFGLQKPTTRPLASSDSWLKKRGKINNCFYICYILLVMTIKVAKDAWLLVNVRTVNLDSLQNSYAFVGMISVAACGTKKSKGCCNLRTAEYKKRNASMFSNVLRGVFSALKNSALCLLLLNKGEKKKE